MQRIGPVGPDIAALAAMAGLPDDVAMAGLLTLGHLVAKPARSRMPLQDLISRRR
ncbi:MAG: hypothetical protein SYR96_26480 [Actinomycetota bacterium]|nr:hypothetical protein [Actinomycetota bacterium]